eukprot:238183-Amphidinium_carterae.1
MAEGDSSADFKAGSGGARFYSALADCTSRACSSSRQDLSFTNHNFKALASKRSAQLQYAMASKPR